MPPKREYGPATRRSTRLASQTNSQVSSTSNETNSGLLRPLPSPPSVDTQFFQVVDSLESAPFCAVESRSKLRTKRVQAAGFDIDVAIRRIVDRDDRGYIKKLTKSQSGAVITVLADRQNDLLDRIKELEEEKEDMARERDEAIRKFEEKRKLRDFFLRDRLRQASEQREEAEADAMAETATQSALPVAQPSTQGQARSAPQDEDIVDEPSMSMDLVVYSDPHAESPAESSRYENEELSASTPANTTPAPTVAETPRATSLLRRLMGTIASPFTGPATPSTAKTESRHKPDQSSSPLGKLPESRKRQAPEPVPDVPARPQAAAADSLLSPTPPVRRALQPATPVHRRYEGPSSKNPSMPTSLSTITEYTEPTLRAQESSPTRAPARTPAQYRTISSVRRAGLQKMAASPARSWSEPRRPREPNADRRLDKLRRFQDIQAELEALKRDEDLKDVVGPRVKRVKVDDLISIPHNRPGDSKGTFCVPDIDSDDEMEVDETTELRTNIFARAEADKQPTLGQQVSPAESAQPSKKDAAPVFANTTTTTTTATQAGNRTSNIFSNNTTPVITATTATQDGNRTSTLFSNANSIVPTTAQSTTSEDEEEEISFDWPDIGKRKPGQEPSEAVQEKAYEIFKRNFAHWDATGEILPWPDIDV